MRFSYCLLLPIATTVATFTLNGAEAPGGGVAGDAARGRILFQQNCALCHATGREASGGGQGPSLAGVMGRRAAAGADFTFTPALMHSGLVWTPATLDQFLANPGERVPGTAMAVATTSAADRRDLIAFLATLQPATPRSATDEAATQKKVRTPGDWENDAPGVKHRIEIAQLPKPYMTESAGNGPKLLPRPAAAELAVPAGFKVSLFASGLSGPRLLRTAPNGDVFIAETRQGRIRVLRAGDGKESPAENTIFASGLHGPFGIAFYPTKEPRWVYVGLLNSVVRFPYHAGDQVAAGPAETIIEKLADSTGGHTTRDVAFSMDDRRMFVSVGSGSNVAERMPVKTAEEVRAWEKGHAHGSAWGSEANRAVVLAADPDGRNVTVFATGIRNAVGLAVQPRTGLLWASTNERDGLGDDLVPDYLTHVQEGGYYGWPWFYLGNHEDPRHAGERPDLAGAAIIPDVLVQAHSATLQMTFYPLEATGPAAFPAEYRGNIFAALHGSWNRHGRTGSKVIRVRLGAGTTPGDYEDFLTGFVIDDQHVWGRPVGVTVAHDGALLVTDDAAGTIWRIAYVGQQR